MRLFALALGAGLCAFAGTATYIYDDAHRLVRVDYGDGASISYAYDKAGNLVSRTIAGAAPAAAASTPTRRDRERPRPKRPASKR